VNRLVELLGGEVHILKRPGQRGDVVAVYLGEAEAEGAPFVCEGSRSRISAVVPADCTSF